MPFAFCKLMLNATIFLLLLPLYCGISMELWKSDTVYSSVYIGTSIIVLYKSFDVASMVNFHVFNDLQAASVKKKNYN